MKLFTIADKMRKAKVIHVAVVGSIRLPVREYAEGRFGFDYTSLAGERVRVRVTNSETAIKRADEIVEHGVGPVDATRRHAAEYSEFLQWQARRIASAPVPKLVAAMLAARQRKGVARPTMLELKSTLDRFAQRFPGNIADLTRKEVEEWMDEREPSPRRWNNMRAAIIALHRYARRDGLLPVELTPVERMDRRKVKVIVGTYTPQEMRDILLATPEEWIPWVTLGAFCGLRPEEIHPDPRAGGYKPRLCWEHILWDKRKVDVPAEIAKDRRRRFAPLTDAAYDFLFPCRKKKGPITSTSQVYRLTWWTALKRKKDGFRHSFASYRLALTKDLPALSLEMGNSVFMIHRHYLDLKHEPEAEAYFAIRRANLCQSPSPKRRNK